MPGKPRGNQLNFSSSPIQPPTFSLHNTSVHCCVQHGWRRLNVQMAAWCSSAYVAISIAAVVAHWGGEPGPILWGVFLCFAVLCGLAAAALFFFAVKREVPAALVTAKVLCVGICFGISGFFVAIVSPRV